MLPDWYLRLSAASGSSFIPAWNNADVAVSTFVAFAVFFVVSTVLAADWPFDVAFLSLVTGGILVSWPAMIAITMAAIVLAMVVGGAHSLLAPQRTARIAAEAQRKVAPALDEFARDAGLGDAERRRLLGDGDSERR